MTKQLEFHTLANLFPLIEGDEFDALVADVKEKGLLDKIVLLDGAILEGRNRYRACLKAELISLGGDPHDRRFFVDFNKENFGVETVERGPLAFVISKNLTRRHLNEGQRAMVAARIANLSHGQTASAKKPNGAGAASVGKAAAVPQGEAAKSLNVSPRSVRSARVVQEQGAPELIGAVDQGRIAVSVAEKAAKLPVEQQRDIVKHANAGKANVVRTVVKAAAREAKEKDLGARQKALPAKRYGVIYADPPWRFEPRSRDTGLDRAADQHYPTCTTDEIAALDVASIAAPDCALFLWATAAMLPDALKVMEAWGFTYKTHRIWHKKRQGNARGTGYWFTGEHELLLLGTKGNPPAPAPGQQYGSVFAGPVGAHSEKPDDFYYMMEAYFRSLPKIELNARKRRTGWDAWGLEAPEAPSAAAAKPKKKQTFDGSGMSREERANKARREKRAAAKKLNAKPAKKAKARK
jgi:N6-adenosine-specific RNA methylase IME4